MEGFISSPDALRFLPSNSIGSTVSQDLFTATLTALNISPSDAERASMISTLTLVVSSSLNGSLVQCHDDMSSVTNILQIAGKVSFPQSPCTLLFLVVIQCS